MTTILIIDATICNLKISCMRKVYVGVRVVGKRKWHESNNLKIK